MWHPETIRGAYGRHDSDKDVMHVPAVVISAEEAVLRPVIILALEGSSVVTNGARQCVPRYHLGNPAVHKLCLDCAHRCQLDDSLIFARGVCTYGACAPVDRRHGNWYAVLR